MIKQENDTNKFSLKDHLFNPAKIELIATEIHNVYPNLNKNQFKEDVIALFPKLELKERIYHITTCLKNHLPNNFVTAVEILLESLPKPCDPDLSDNDFGNFIYAPYNHFVASFGCDKENLDFSLNALKELTTRFSAEDAIRYFINAFPQETMDKVNQWASHPHYHVRRLASEGTRAKLPWCQKIIIQPASTIPILENLYFDNTRYVTRSVANHLNDLSKINSKLVIDTLKSWKKEGKQQTKEMDFIIRHSLRTLIKNGDKNALELIGFNENPPIEIISFEITENVKMNTHLTFRLELVGKEASNLLIDYVIFFQNKNGEMNSKKVFKLKQLQLKRNEKAIVSKKHLMREFMSTRTLYSGTHLCQLQVNGQIIHEKEFELI